MSSTIGERLAKARALSGLSAAALGENCGLSRAIVSMIEAEKRENPNTKTLKAIQSALADAGVVVSIAWLIDGTGEEPKLGQKRPVAKRRRAS